MINQQTATVAAPSTSLARRNALRIGAVVAFVGLTALSSFVKIPLPGTPVPATLQTLIVILAGLLIGGRLATVSMAAYLALGSAGYFLFAAANGSTLGYLVGFVVAQPLIGLIARPLENRRTQLARLVAAVAVGHAAIFVCGLSWLWVWSSFSLPVVIAMGFIPFAGVDLVLKSAAALAIGSLAIRPARRLLELE